MLNIIRIQRLIYFNLLFLSYLINKNVYCQKVGAQNFSPMMECTEGKTLSLYEIKEQKLKSVNEDDLDFSGYELDILIKTATIVNSDPKNIFVTCYATETELLNDLSASKIDYGIGGLSIDSDKLQKGYSYTLPLYSGGLKAAVKVNDSKDIWSFFQPFHWSLWVVMFFTTIFVSVMTWLFEDKFSNFSCFKNKQDQNSQKGNNSIQETSGPQKNINNQLDEMSKEDNITQYSSSSQKGNSKMQEYQNFLEMIWQSFSSIFFASSIRLQTFSARIILLGFWFVVIIVTATYVSNLTILLQFKKQKSSLTNFQDIIKSGNVKIFTFENYINKYINPSNFNKDQKEVFVTQPRTKKGLENLINEFNSNSISGSISYNVLLIDTPIVHNVHSKYPCSTLLLQETLSNFNYGILVKNQVVLKELNSILYNFIDDPYWLNLIQTYLNETPQEHSCFLKEKHIHLYSIAGLWVLLGISIAVAILINRIDVYLKKSALNKKEKENLDISKQPMINTNSKLKVTVNGKLDKQQQILSPTYKEDEIASSQKKEDSIQFQNVNGQDSKNANGISIHESKLRGGNSVNGFDKSQMVTKRNNSGFISKGDMEEEDQGEVWSNFLMVSDYIHIPSKDIHLEAKQEVQTQLAIVESVIKKRFNNVEDNIIRILKKCPIKVSRITDNFDKDDKYDKQRKISKDQ